MRLFLSAVGIVLVVAIIGWLVSLGSEPDPDVTSELDAAPKKDHSVDSQFNTPGSRSDWVPPQITFDNYESQSGSLPPSLAGTTVPFFLQINERGELVVNEALRDTFDYFFTTVGEEPLEIIIARIQELIKKHLPETAQGRALQVLNQYVDLKQGEIALQEQLALDFQASGRQTDLAERARLLRELRASHLDPEAYAAFFGEEDKRDEYALQKLQIVKDKSLSPAERQAALESIEEYLPPAAREQARTERKAQHTLFQVEQAKEEGASAEEVFQMREQAFGAEAAERFAEADQRKSAWDARIAVYRAERAEILASDGMTDADKEYEIEQLRAQHFEELELKRIPVIDRMMDQSQ